MLKNANQVTVLERVVQLFDTFIANVGNVFIIAQARFYYSAPVHAKVRIKSIKSM